FFLRALRPHQWTKNLLVFAALLFSKHLFEPVPFFRAALAFVAFCGLAGAVYLWNDIADVERDRLHPKKRGRPIASGDLSIRSATMGALALVAATLALSFWLDLRLGLCAASYLALNLAYSFALKHVVILDVLSISIGFVLRALAGGYAINVPVTDWLLVLTLLLALFLALAKRRHEITSLMENAVPHRAILAEYSPYLIDQMTSVVTASVVTAYAFYTLSPETVLKFGTAKLSWTLPLVLYGIFRYLYLVHQKDRGDSPTDMLLTDRPLLATVALWVALVIAIVYTAQGVATPLGDPR
ncbi:MAG: decaprenyl-phosphate phosphoribosyltransferase, partial [Vicinamibacteria bacterium]|nr:decaprenyl-phosphate phosphoribosyltransferase [Vicinamibacteria bacterium]